MNKRIIAAALGAAALAVPAAAVAQPGHARGKPTKAVEKSNSKVKKAKTVNFVFKGTFIASGTVSVSSGNAHVRKGGFVGEEISFDLATAKIVGDDTNVDLEVTLLDVTDGDKVLVQARLARRTEYAAITATDIVARKLIDQTRVPAEEPATP